MRRLAAEIDRAVRGKRISHAGRLGDDRFGIVAGKVGLVLDPFSPTPIVSLDSELEVPRSDGGWSRAFEDALVGLRVDAVRARRGDRLIAIECSAQSRFGVKTGYRLVCELTPRFGNLVLLKDDTIVAAAREFSRGAAVRATVVGDAYEPPPLPVFAELPGALAAAFAVLARGDDAASRGIAVRALRAAVPLVPPLVAESLVYEAAALGAVAGLDEVMRRRAAAVVSSTDGDPHGIGDVFAYRDGERLVQCHVYPLAQYAHLATSRVPEIAPLVSASLATEARERSLGAFASRRARLRARPRNAKTPHATMRAAATGSDARANCSTRTSRRCRRTFPRSSPRAIRA